MNLEAKADRGSLLGGVFLAGYITCAIVNHVQALWSEHGVLQAAHVTAAQVPVIAKQAAKVPVLAAKVGCEHWVAEKRGEVAKQAIKGANSDSVPIPDAKDVVADNCAGTPRK